MMNIFKCLFLLFIINGFYCNDQNDSNIIDFIPTNEWKIVKTGQKIPPGLHIRSNLQTGVTEAKLLNKNDKNNENTAVIFSNNDDTTLNDSISTYSPAQLKKMLKGVKDESPVQNKTVEINGTKFRSYDELKKDFESLQMSIKTDLEIIRELLNELQGEVDDMRTVIILKDLEYYLHQIDNAQNFVDMGGLVYLHKFMNSKVKDIKSEALRCLSSALQGNSKVKVEAMKNGTLIRVLDLLKSSSDSSTINQILVVVSAITRQFPIAQLAFVNGDGLRISGEVFDKFSVIEDEKISIRIMTLISDWLKERNMDELKKLSLSDLDRNDIVEKENQYKKVDLHSPLLQQGWCARLKSLVYVRKERSVDYLEKLIISISNLYSVCHRKIEKEHFLRFLDDAHERLVPLAKEEVDDFYYQDFLQLIKDTSSMIKTYDQNRKTEL